MGTFFEELPELLRLNIKGEVDVDDFFYLIMMQWAKLTSLSVARSEFKIPMAEKINPYSKALENEKQDRELRKQEEIRIEEFRELKRKALAQNDIMASLALESKASVKEVEKEVVEEEKDIVPSTTSFSLTKNPFSAMFLNQFVESAYKPIGTFFDCDVIRTVAMRAVHSHSLSWGPIFLYLIHILYLFVCYQFHCYLPPALPLLPTANLIDLSYYLLPLFPFLFHTIC